VIEIDGDTMRTRFQTVKMTDFSNPAELPWKELGVDFVVEATGAFRKRAQLEQHLEAGAKKDILTVPAKDEIDCTVVLGVNEADLKPEHRIVPHASCTTNCLAPMAKVLDDAFGIKSGAFTTVHAYTGDQAIVDMLHPDPRRARAAAQNIIPASTGAASAVGKVLPNLAGKLLGTALRVPISDGSITDLVVTLSRDVTVDEVNDALRTAAEGPMKGIMRYTEDPIVSSDIIGDPHSVIVDGLSTIVSGRTVKVFGWYDNEWGYSCRTSDLAALMAEKGI